MQNRSATFRAIHDTYRRKQVHIKQSRSPKGCGLVRAAFSRPALVCLYDSAAQGIFLSSERSQRT